MKLFCFVLVISCSLAGMSLRAQLPQAVLDAQREKLLQGVTTVPKSGAPGPVAIWGNLAFPILAAPDKDGVEHAVAAGAGYGTGRMILFGHNGYIEDDQGGDHGKLIENCVKWLSKKEKPRLGLKNIKSPEFYKGHGFNVKVIKGNLSSKELRDCDVVVLNMQTVTDAEQGAALAAFVKNGGALMAGMTGWAFGQTSGGKDLAASHELNQALMAAGIAITSQSAFVEVKSFEPRVSLPLLLNAADAIVATKKQTSGTGAKLSGAEAKLAASSIQLAISAQPPGSNNLQAAVMGAIGSEGQKSAVPTQKDPLTQDKDAASRTRLGMETRALRLAGAEVAAHPAAAIFPGKVPEGAPRVTQEVQINPDIPGWASTGLYAAAGETITVTVPAAVANTGFSLRIGCHTDSLYHLDKWERAPEITKSTPLTTAELKSASAFGGLIYIDVPMKSKVAKGFTAVIKGGVPAPLFVLGRDDDARWNAELKMRPAPWAEFACDKVILSCPSEVARKVSNPTQLMEFWKKVVEAQDDISNQAGERRRPERIVTDVQISAGYMHSGYPIMVPTSTAAEMVTFSKLKFPGWGFYHELGHNHQRGDFTFDGTTEVTNNVLGMYVYQSVLEKDWLIGHPEISPEARKSHVLAIQKAPNKWTEWKKNPFVALTTYIELVQGFGWEAWRKYLYSFSDDSFGPKPETDDEKRDQFLVRYSKIVNKNLAPFFEKWGIPVSAAAKAEVSKFENWQPNGT